MQRLLIVVTLSLFTALSSYAQRLQGTATTPAGSPIGGLSVSLLGTAYGTLTTEQGSFALDNVVPGTYTLVASGLGYQTTRQAVAVAAGQTTTVALQVSKNQLSLEEVTVLERPARARDKASAYAARLPIANLENPQVLNTVPNQVIVEQAALDLTTITRNLPGVSKGWASVSTYFTSRGFNTRNYYRNGVASYSTADLDPVNIEQLVAVKGPVGTLFGGPLVSFGGLLNRITKRPFDGTHVELSYQAGSYDLSRFTADVNTALTRDKRLLLRVTAAQHYEGSFQDAGFVRGTFVAPSLLYKVNDRLSLSLDAEFYAREQTSAPQISPLGPRQAGTARVGASSPAQTRLDYRRSYGNNTVTLHDPNLSVYAQANYKLSDQWTSQSNVTRTQTQNLGNYLTFSLLRGDSTLRRNVTQYPTSLFTVTQLQQNFIGDFQLGPLRNRLLVGLDFYQNSSNFSSNAPSGRVFDTLAVTRAMPRYGLISPATITAKIGNLVPAYSSSSQSVYGAYVSDVVNLTPRLSAMLSLRVDRFVSAGSTNLATNITAGDYQQTALSPKLGLVYEVLPGRVSVFGNYNSGFQNVTGTDVNGRQFKPQYGNQLEGGVKAELKQDVLSATVSYYDIRVDNTLRGDVNNVGFSIQDGTQFSRGVEVDVQARPVSGLLMLAGFTYNDSRLTAADATVSDRRPATAGPARTVNFWASYSLPTQALRGLGAGFGGNYFADNLLINSTTAGQFTLPAYTLLNAGVFFNRPRYRLAANLDNLANRQYYTGGFGNYTPGMLRRFIGTFTLKF
jgi:iron complex outermembrane receptor protein